MEAENNRIEQMQKDIEAQETRRQFRHTVEWLIEQGPEQTRDLTFGWLNSPQSLINNDNSLLK
jgi:hypothetical protein